VGNSYFNIRLTFLLSSYVEYIESIGFTPKKLKINYAKIMFFTDKKSSNVKKAINFFPSVTRRRRRP
jgi:hypothetical protein